ncbi:hypothetical protein H5410_025900 [Solanum commersonii]|uniref:Uncharacterized protein n=1 Tax=Solanum commersonii TaxID=4109 RepID=A0A9J5YX67_SOLCO|nr:hypothetical protein H5410_025900 [Solanum commersonii]
MKSNFEMMPQFLRYMEITILGVSEGLVESSRREKKKREEEKRERIETFVEILESCFGLSPWCVLRLGD